MNVEDIRLYIDGRWELADLDILTRVYIQVYGLIYSLDVADDYSDRKIQYIYGKYPWRGGYSAVNFYQSLFSTMPHRYRPRIQSIHYASPGFIELAQLADVAKDISLIVGFVCAALAAGNKTYNAIQRGIADRKLSKLDLRGKELDLLEKERDFLHKSVNDIAETMGVRKETLAKLYFRTENNDLAVLKILSSLYRRARDLARLQNERKLDLKRGIVERNSPNKQIQG